MFSRQVDMTDLFEKIVKQRWEKATATDDASVAFQIAQPANSPITSSKHYKQVIFQHMADSFQM